MLKKMMMAAVVVVFCVAVSHAANINVAAGSSIQTAINSASDGDTITLTSTAIYKGNIRIYKSLKLVAAAGVTPTVEQADNTTTNPVILGATLPNQQIPSSIQIGSMTGGRITFQYLKWGVATPTTLPTGMIRVEVTTGSTVLIQNCDITTTGTATYAPISGIQHGQNPATVTVKYTDINLNRGTYNAGGVSGNRCNATGIDISNNSPTGGATITRRVPGPTYNLDHVRIKGFFRSGMWLHYTSMTLNASYIDVGTKGEFAQVGTSNNLPWGPVASYNQLATWFGRIDHSILQGGRNYFAFGGVPCGTSVTMSRTVIVTQAGSTSYGGLFLGCSAAGTRYSDRVRVTLDHCDVVALGTANAGAIHDNANSSVTLTIKNSIVYSESTRAFNMTYHPIVVSDYNNVFGAPLTNNGYTPGAHDISYDPLYFDQANLDLRYSNNTLKTADSEGGAVGVNGGYADVVGGIIAGNPGVINAARYWTLVK